MTVFEENSVAVLFDGQGVFGPGMGKAAYDRYAASREVFKESSEAVGFDLARVCFGDLTYLQNDSRIIQPAIVNVDLAEYAAWKEIHGDADVVTGLSLGILAAYGAANVFESYAHAVDLSARRARIMHEVAEKNPGKMAGAVGMVLHELDPIVKRAGAEFAVIRDRIRKSVVITGSPEAVDEVEVEAKKRGLRKWEPLNIFGAYHSKHQKDAVCLFDGEFSKFRLRDPQIRLLGSNAVYLATAADAQSHALEQLTQSADWDASINVLAEEGIRRVVEMGPDESRGLARQMVRRFNMEAIDFPPAT